MRKNGFTLVEILAAAVITALIAFTAVGALHAITASREKVDHHLAAMSELRFAADRIRADLLNLYRNTDQNSTKFIGDVNAGELGSNSDLIFHAVHTAAARPGQPEGDVYEVEYFLQSDGQRPVFMRRLDPYPLEKDTAGGVLMPIADHILAFEARYYDQAANTWETRWSQEQQKIPAAIEVTLTAGLPEEKKVISHSFLVYFPRWPAAAPAPTANQEPSVKNP